MDRLAKLETLERKLNKTMSAKAGASVSIVGKETILISRGLPAGEPGGADAQDGAGSRMLEAGGFEIMASFVDLKSTDDPKKSAPKRKGGIPWFSEKTRLRIEGDEAERNWILLNTAGEPVCVDVRRGPTSSVEEINSLLSIVETVLFRQ